MRREKGFTLIELLVVIAVIALLMAILMPTLHRVKRQTKAVICLSNLRQWSLWFSMYTQDNDDKFFSYHYPNGNYWNTVMRPYYKDSNDVLFCPMAMKHKCEGHEGLFRYSHKGKKFSSWAIPVGPSHLPPRYLYGSYGMNGFVRARDHVESGPHWRSILVKSPGNIPVFFDCQNYRYYADNVSEPPPYEGMGASRTSTNENVCMNRHDGYVNALFLDWTVRRVGLKELWTLKWRPDFNTAGPWTRAGGVKPEDWPEWMRKFKDY